MEGQTEIINVLNIFALITRRKNIERKDQMD